MCMYIVVPHVLPTIFVNDISYDSSSFNYTLGSYWSVTFATLTEILTAVLKNISLYLYQIKSVVDKICYSFVNIFLETLFFEMAVLSIFTLWNLLILVHLRI
jgi:hypothetical protein